MMILGKKHRGIQILEHPPKQERNCPICPDQAPLRPRVPDEPAALDARTTHPKGQTDLNWLALAWARGVALDHLVLVHT